MHTDPTDEKTTEPEAANSEAATTDTAESAPLASADADEKAE